MKRMIAALLGLLMALPAACAAGGAWYEKECTLRAEKSAPFALSVKAEGFEGELALALPEKEEAADLPLHAVFYTLNKALFADAADEKAASERLARLFILPEGTEAAFEKTEQGFALKDALPVMLKEKALLDQADVAFGTETVKLADMKAGQDYQPLQAAYLGYVTARSDCNVREGASPSTKRLALIQKGTTLPVTGKDKGWHQVLLPDGQKGYMAPKVVAFEPLKTPDSVPALVQEGDIEGAGAVLTALGLDAAAATLQDCEKYLEALRLTRQGDYTAAREAYRQLGAFGGAAARAAQMEGLESLPADTLLYGKEADSATCELKLVAGRAGDPYCVKVYRTGEEEPMAILFVPSGGTAALRLPLGSYSLAYGSGSLWYGVEKAFGEKGRYEKLNDPILFEKDGMRCVLTFAPEDSPNGKHTALAFSAF